MDPIGFLVGAIAVGVAAGLKKTAAQSVRDAYAAIKTLICDCYDAALGSLRQVEASPESRDNRARLESDLRLTKAPEDARLMLQAGVLLRAVQANDPEAARVVGVDLANLVAASLKLEGIVASGKGNVTAVRVTDAEFTGDIHIRNVRAEEQVRPKG